MSDTIAFSASNDSLLIRLLHGMCLAAFTVVAVDMNAVHRVLSFYRLPRIGKLSRNQCASNTNSENARHIGELGVRTGSLRSYLQMPGETQPVTVLARVATFLSAQQLQVNHDILNCTDDVECLAL